jgi:putative zinc finger protein
MTCEQVRDLLPEHLLGSLDGDADARVEHHLRGCTDCRGEQLRLEDGVATLAYATHETTPPEALRDHVLAVLDEEWHASEDDPGHGANGNVVPMRRRAATTWLAVAAALLLVVGSFAFAVSQRQHALRVQADATSYQSLLSTLGGKEFRLGQLQTSNDTGVSGKVILYDGDPKAGWNSWGIVLARGPANLTDAEAVLMGPGGESMQLPPLKFSDGEASTWLVTHEDLTKYDELVITSPAGNVLASARIAEA